ncbi:unnamed protein product [Dibothriocephalus latus]|uniref:Uncharacterized protein n=1 Tax=Dibothriocephalus latus TaxID=60516 RepID=A0A3P6R456_DIBLA|nr:unnamed protein product [Dibothriocephalus latus]
MIIPFLERVIFMPHDWDDEIEENEEAKEEMGGSLRVSNLNSSGASSHTLHSISLSDDMTNHANGSSTPVRF